MNKHYAAALLAAMALAGPVQAQQAGLLPRAIENYGDHMGMSSGMTGKVVTYYNADNRPVAEVTYNTSGGASFALASYKVFEYNADGKLQLEWSRNYRVGMGGRKEWQNSKDTISYVYDEAGRLVEEKNQFNGDNFVYEYDAEGNMTRKAKVVPDYYDQYEGDTYEMWSEEYSDFAAPGCPRTIIGEGLYDSYVFTATAAYDADGNITEKKTYNVYDELSKVERWTYADGRLALYESFKVKTKGGEQVETPERRTRYDVVSTEPLRIEKLDSTYSEYDGEGEWTESSRPSITEYFAPDPATAPELTVAKAKDGVNAAVLTFNATKIDGVQNVAYDVYRNGTMLARIDASEAEDGVITYRDELAPNGTTDYFVQAVDASQPSQPGHGMNSSDRISVVFDLALPAPTNVRAHKVEYEAGTCYVTVKWDEPEGKDTLGFQSYNIYLEGMRMPINSGGDTYNVYIYPISGNSYRVSLGSGNAASDLSERVFVEAVYDLGAVTTDVVTITNDTYDMDKLLLRTTERWGDHLGEVSTDKITTKTVNYYNADSLLTATVRYGANVRSGIYEPSDYTGVLFDAQGLPVKTFSQQRGLYDGLHTAWAEANDTTYYTYDEQGRIIREQSTHSTDSIVYEYDEQGRQTGFYRYVPDYNNEYPGDFYVMESQEYDDFNEAGLPQTIYCDGAYDSYRYTVKVAYDEDNNVIRRETYNLSDVLTQIERYSYDIGVLTLYELTKVKNVQGSGDNMTYDESPSKRIVYTIVGHEPLRVKEEVFDYMYGAWGGKSYFDVKEYFEPQGESAPKLTMEPVEGDVNSLKLTFNATEIEGVDNVVYDVFRHGIKVARLSADDAEGGQLTYIDKNVENGAYDYFVQAVDADAALDGEEAMNSYGYGMNVSNVVRQTLSTELPAPANVHVAKVEYEGGECFVTIEWDEPADKDAFLFQYYNMFEDDSKSPINSTVNSANEPVDDPILTNSYRLSLGQGNEASKLSRTICVEAVYTVGKAKSGFVTVTNEPVADGIDAVAGGGCIRMSGSTLIAGEGAEFDVYAADGTVVATGCQGSLSLGGRQAGVYIVKVRQAGNVATQKVVLRAND